MARGKGRRKKAKVDPLEEAKVGEIAPEPEPLAPPPDEPGAPEPDAVIDAATMAPALPDPPSAEDPVPNPPRVHRVVPEPAPPGKPSKLPESPSGLYRALNEKRVFAYGNETLIRKGATMRLGGYGRTLLERFIDQGLELEPVPAEE